MRQHIIAAGVLLALEGALGVGLLGGGVGMAGVAVALFGMLSGKGKSSESLRIAAIYALLLLATIGLLRFNWRFAQSRAAPVISACKRFDVEHSRYPKTLDELVPAYLPSVPNAKYTIVARKFGYEPTRPQLYFSAMYHGVVSYDFPTNTWRTNE